MLQFAPGAPATVNKVKVVYSQFTWCAVYRVDCPLIRELQPLVSTRWLKNALQRRRDLAGTSSSPKW